MGYPTVPGGSSLDGITANLDGIAQGQVPMYDGSGLIPANVIDGIDGGEVTSNMLASGAALANIGDGNITQQYIGSSAVMTSKINNGAVTEDKIAGSAVTVGKIGADAVRGTKIDPSNTFLTTLALQGRNGAGACTLTGAAVGDKVLVVSFHYGTAPSANPTWETTVTVANQLQQGSGSDFSAAFFTVLLQKRT